MDMTKDITVDNEEKNYRQQRGQWTMARTTDDNDGQQDDGRQQQMTMTDNLIIYLSLCLALDYLPNHLLQYV